MATREERSTESTMTPPAIRPFRIDVPEEEVVELRRRIAATRWPSKELVDDSSKGVQFARRFTNSRATGRRITIGASARRG
jgi:hypothetical protein